MSVDFGKKKEKEEAVDLSFPNQKITDVDMEKEVKKSFIEYSMSVITSRALPDVRDGLKPGQRRVLYAMYEDHLTHDKPFRKSATTVGNVLGRYHPHGDSSVYLTMVRMAQDFSLRYPLVEGHGNFGSVDGDAPAAYRYTEARLARIADEMMRDLDKEVVPMVPNFDNRLREPSVLPARIPNLLVNGSVGIAVGMATNVPPHNMGEVIDAAIYRMENQDCSIEELMEFIKGPDFPSGAYIYGLNGIKHAYMTGTGKIVVRSKATVEEEEHRIIVTELPYGVNKSLLCKAIADLAKDKRIEGITDLRDESGRNGMRIVIEYRRDINGQILLNQLYKFTQLQDTFSVYMLALVNGEPKILNLAQVLDHFITHQESVIRNRVIFDLNKAKARAHILEGYSLILDHIDEVIALLKKSASIPEAKDKLKEQYDLSDIQAQAIVELPLGRLTGLERQKIEDELTRLHEMIVEFEGILADENKIKGIIKTEMLEIKEKYADARRTEIVQAEHELILADLIEKHDCVITMSHAGYIKRQPADTFAAQHRGGKGIIGMGTKDDDFVEKALVVFSHSILMLFTNTGRVYSKNAYEISEASRTSKGTFIANLLELQPGEKISSFFSLNEFEEDKYLVMVTKRGIVKKTPVKEYEYQRKGGKKAISLEEGDELLNVILTDGKDELILATHNANAIRIEETQIRPMGRTAHGVRGIRLRDNDYVVGVAQIEEGKKLITVTENGFGKQSEYDDFRLMKNRGGYGVRCHNLSDKTGGLVGILSVDENDDLMLVTSGGTIIRTPVSDISTYSRTAGGVILMRTEEENRIVNFTKVARVSDEELADVETESDDVWSGMPADEEDADEGAPEDETDDI
ncbi:MAG: DNA gyrase subunit A [Clostridia bacterium]|nr:DNA gyrase subunit A [Clostridia bacterium]